MKLRTIFLSLICTLTACTNDEILENEELGQRPVGVTRSVEVESWDWTNSANYTYAYIQGKGSIPVSSPFTTASSANKDISLIIQGKDYLPAQGWVLLDKVFGSKEQYAETMYPYFMLYNKYRGIVRLFVFNNSQESHSSAMVTLNWLGSKTNALLASNFSYTLPANSTQAKSTDTKVVNYVDDYYSSSWFVTDFIVSFDPKTDAKNNYTLEFKIYSEVKSEVDLQGTLHFETRSATMLGNNASSPSIGSPFAVAGKVLSKLPDEKAITDAVKAVNTLTGTGGAGGKELKDKLNNTQSELESKGFVSFISNITSAAKGLGGIIGSVAGIADIFIGKSSPISKVEIMPTVSEGTTTMQGNITTKTNAARYVLQLPGTNHVYADGSVNADGLPVYDKPLGVFCLEEEPQIDRLRVIDRYERRHGDDEYYVSYKYRSFKVTGNIKIAINKASGLEYVAGTAQLLTSSTLNSRHEEVYDPVDDDEYMTLLRNDGTEWYGTSPIALEKFKNVSLRGETDNLYLKITLVLKVVDGVGEDTPVVVSNTYKIENATDKGESGSVWDNPMSGREHISCGTPYAFSPYQKKNNADPATSESNALTIKYY